MGMMVEGIDYAHNTSNVLQLIAESRMDNAAA
jgi:hypothetical protein